MNSIAELLYVLDELEQMAREDANWLYLGKVKLAKVLTNDSIREQALNESIREQALESRLFREQAFRKRAPRE